MTRSIFAVLALAFALAAIQPPRAGAVEPSEMLADSLLELRAREISKGLRCVVCQNQSIDESDADLARDLRVLVRDRLVMGDSDTEVVNYVVSRYGDYVLLKPPFKAATLVLWAGPALLALGGLIGIIFGFRRSGRAAHAGTAPLSAEERRRIEALLKDDGDA